MGTVHLMQTASSVRRHSSSSFPALPADHEVDKQFDGGAPLPRFPPGQDRKTFACLNFARMPNFLETMGDTPPEDSAYGAAAPLDHQSMVPASWRNAILLLLSLSTRKPKPSPLTWRIMLTSIGMTPSSISSACPVTVPTPPSDLRKVIVEKEKLDMMCALVVAQRTIVHPGNFDNFFCLTRFEVGICSFKNKIASVMPSALLPPAHLLMAELR